MATNRSEISRVKSRYNSFIRELEKKKEKRIITDSDYLNEYTKAEKDMVNEIEYIECLEEEEEEDEESN